MTVLVKLQVWRIFQPFSVPEREGATFVAARRLVTYFSPLAIASNRCYTVPRFGISSGVYRTDKIEFVSNSQAIVRRIGWLHGRNGFAE